jgi:hypothetical protein
VDTTAVWEFNDLDKAIVKMAKEINPDLLVVGHHSQKSLVDKLFASSVAKQLLVGSFSALTPFGSLARCDTVCDLFPIHLRTKHLALS